MAKRIIKFDGEKYSIEETKFDPAISRLAQFLTDELAGTGVTIKLGGRTYSVDGQRVSTATDGFTSYLESIEGDNIDVKVSGTIYGLSRAAIEDGYETVHLTLAGLSDGDIPDEPEEPELPASEGLEFELNDDGQSYYVKGIGTCEDTDIVIPDMHEGLPVTSIGYEAFYNCSSLTSVTIPDSVTSIGYYAFRNCSSLMSVTIPNSITTIGTDAFEGCTSLTGVYIDDIASWCNIEFEFDDVSGGLYANPLVYAKNLYLNNGSGTYELVTDLVIPNDVARIGNFAFCNCEGLTSVIIPDSIMSIGKYAFENCTGLTSVTIPDSVKSIGERAFNECTSLASVTIGSGVTSIGWSAFEGCSGLTSIEIPNSVTSIGNAAFENCTGLTSVTIPSSVTSIGWYAFYHCSSLTEIIFNGTMEEWNTIEKDILVYGVPASYVQCTDGQVAI